MGDEAYCTYRLIILLIKKDFSLESIVLGKTNQYERFMQNIYGNNNF